MKPLWIIVFVVALVWSGYQPKDYFTWFLEVVPAMLGGLVMAFTYRSFKLTPLLYVFILVHCVVLMIGGHYTYAEVPFFDGLFGAERNNYDKVGHFFQGFVPALITREILIRKNAVNGRSWLNVCTLAIPLAFSAFYELIEWWVAVLSGDDSVAFLGTQGYVWDTQSDMAFAMLGALILILFFSRWHDHQLNQLSSSDHEMVKR